MKVKILVEFDVEPIELEDGDELSENNAKDAASLAAWHNLALTENGMSVVESTDVHVDGFGLCSVTLGEAHE